MDNELTPENDLIKQPINEPRNLSQPMVTRPQPWPQRAKPQRFTSVSTAATPTSRSRANPVAVPRSLKPSRPESKNAASPSTSAKPTASTPACTAPTSVSSRRTRGSTACGWTTSPRCSIRSRNTCPIGPRGNAPGESQQAAANPALPTPALRRRTHRDRPTGSCDRRRRYVAFVHWGSRQRSPLRPPR